MQSLVFRINFEIYNRDYWSNITVSQWQRWPQPIEVERNIKNIDLVDSKMIKVSAINQNIILVAPKMQKIVVIQNSASQKAIWLILYWEIKLISNI